ncbi:hypothetical protein THF1C08_180050 [Vibrio jasicida]|nr:hypothetical protein THF1C08_180050 [Vibrio jasicida]
MNSYGYFRIRFILNVDFKFYKYNDLMIDSLGFIYCGAHALKI